MSWSVFWFDILTPSYVTVRIREASVTWHHIAWDSFECVLLFLQLDTLGKVKLETQDPDS